MRAWERHAHNGVPASGRDAFQQAWDTSACPHDPQSVAAMLWLSDWWRANAEAFAGHIGEVIEPSRDFVNGWAARDAHYDGYADEAVENGHISHHWVIYLRTGNPNAES